VPFVTQYDARGNGGNNCGAAVLTSMLAANGACAPTSAQMQDVADRCRDGILDGRGRQGGYINFANLLAEAKRWGYDSWWVDNFVIAEVTFTGARRPVCLLVDNTRLTPRVYPRSPAFDAHHFFALTGMEGDDYLVMDPLSLHFESTRYTIASVHAYLHLACALIGVRFLWRAAAA
jgi:hypothetical protein